jgi:hypothetical protein
MPLLCRKIKASRWERKSYLDTDEISADAAKCISTIDGKLSVWIHEADRGNIDDVALALATSMEKLEAFQIVIFDSSDLKPSASFPLLDVLGNTALADFNSQHRDLSKLDFVRLGMLAVIISSRVRANVEGNVYPYSVKQVTKLLVDGIAQKRVEMSALKESLREKIRPHVAAQ